MAKKLYDEYEAEVELEDEIKEEEEEISEIHKPKATKKDEDKKDNKWLGRILCLILGFFIGVGAVWGTIAAVAGFVLFQPIDTTVGVLDPLTGGAMSDLMFGEKDENGNVIKAGILDEKYAELKVKDLLGDSLDAVKQLSSNDGSLAPLNEISPKVGDTLDKVIEGLSKYGIPLDRDTMLNAPLKNSEDSDKQSFGAYFKSSLLEASAGDFFTALGSTMTPMLEALCYGKEGVDYVVGEDGTVTMINGAKKTTLGDLLGDNMTAAFDDVFLRDALDVKADSNRVLIAIAYGNDYVIQNDEIIGTPRTIGELRASNGAFIDDIPLTSVLEEDRSNGVIMYMLYGKKGIHYGIDADGNIVMKEQRVLILNNNVYNAYGEALTKQQGVEGEADYVAGYTLNFADKLYTDANGHEYKLVNARETQSTKDGVADVYYIRELDDSKVLYAPHTLHDLDGTDNLVSSLNDRLTIGELMDKEDIENNKFLKHVTNYTITDLPKALEELSINEVYADEIYDANGNVQGAWKYLICTYGSNGQLIEHEYTLNHLDPLIDNMKENIHQTTLNELAHDGIINFSDETLSHGIKTQIYSPDQGGYVAIDLDFLHGKTSIGELTLDEMIEYTDTIVQLI